MLCSCSQRGFMNFALNGFRQFSNIWSTVGLAFRERTPGRQGFRNRARLTGHWLSDPIVRAAGGHTADIQVANERKPTQRDAGDLRPSYASNRYSRPRYGYMAPDLCRWPTQTQELGAADFGHF